MLRKLMDKCKNWGLNINVDKTQYMIIGGAGYDLKT